MSTNFLAFFANLDGGIFTENLALILSEAAKSTVDHNKISTVNLRFNFAKMGDNNQVIVESIMDVKCPTENGETTELCKSTTPFRVTENGDINFFSDETTMFDIIDGLPESLRQQQNG